MHHQGAAVRVIFLTEKSRFREDGSFQLDGANLHVLDPQRCVKEVISRQLVAAEARSRKRDRATVSDRPERKRSLWKSLRVIPLR